MTVSTASEYRGRSWRRGEIRIDTESGAARVRGWVCSPFGAHETADGGWSLDHLPTGGRVALRRTLAECKDAAHQLVLYAGGTGPWEEATETHRPPKAVEALSVLRTLDQARASVAEVPGRGTGGRRPGGEGGGGRTHPGPGRAGSSVSWPGVTLTVTEAPPMPQEPFSCLDLSRPPTGGRIRPSRDTPPEVALPEALPGAVVSRRAVTVSVTLGRVA